jgi:uncharacterized membrane protein YoaK (UPF0700 family)
MLIRQGQARSGVVDRRLACTLAAVAGAVNTAAFHAVGFFSANMTGNVSALSDRAALGQWLSAGFYLMIVLAFIAGSAAATLLISAGKRRAFDGIYALAILVEAVLMMLLGGIALWVLPAEHDWMLVLGLSFLMGLQNAAVTRISEARVRTTHISGMATDIGIELAMLFDIARGREAGAEQPANQSKLRLHGLTILSFLAGGVVGVLAYRMIGDLLLPVISIVLLAIALPGLTRALGQRQRAGAGR